MCRQRHPHHDVGGMFYELIAVQVKDRFYCVGRVGCYNVGTTLSVQ